MKNLTRKFKVEEIILKEEFPSISRDFKVGEEITITDLYDVEIFDYRRAVRDDYFDMLDYLKEVSMAEEILKEMLNDSKFPAHLSTQCDWGDYCIATWGDKTNDLSLTKEQFTYLFSNGITWRGNN